MEGRQLTDLLKECRYADLPWELRPHESRFRSRESALRGAWLQTPVWEDESGPNWKWRGLIYCFIEKLQMSKGAAWDLVPKHGSAEKNPWRARHSSNYWCWSRIPIKEKR